MTATAATVESAFPQFADPRLLERIAETGREMRFEPGERIMDYGRYVKTVPLLLEGLVKIARQDEEGRELLLYYLEPGETCAMSLTCCMGSKKSEIRAEVEEPTRLVAIPVEAMDEWLDEFPAWKRFVMSTYAGRFEELLQALDAVAFLQLDERLVRFLQARRKATEKDVIRLSHQEIAGELHSTREVVSRLLKKLERDGRVELRRNRIRLLPSLDDLAVR